MKQWLLPGIAEKMLTGLSNTKIERQINKYIEDGQCVLQLNTETKFLPYCLKNS